MNAFSRRALLKGSAAFLAGTAASACAAPPPRRTSVSTLPSGLRALADQAGLRFGSAVSRTVFDSPNRPQLLDVFARDFNLATLHSGFYWNAWEPEPGKINQTALTDMQVQAATLQSIGITDLRGHPLVFPTVEPAWLMDGLKGGQIKKAQAIDVLPQHIHTVMTPFKGVIGEWAVVNEPYRFYGPDRGDYWKLVIGEEYVELAFRAAREADPAAKLLLNDYDNHAISGRNRYSSDQDPIHRSKLLIERLKTKGLVDGLGLQMHLQADKPPKKDDLIETMRGYGVPVHITELDVNLKNVIGSDDARFALQAQIFADVLDAALASGVCQSVCLWEFGDKYSWLEDPWFDFASPLAGGTPYNDALKPKPAYDAMKQVLLSR